MIQKLVVYFALAFSVVTATQGIQQAPPPAPGGGTGNVAPTVQQAPPPAPGGGTGN